MILTQVKIKDIFWPVLPRRSGKKTTLFCLPFVITNRLLKTFLKFILILNFRFVFNVVFFLLGDSPASDFYVPTFRKTLFHLQWTLSVLSSVKMEQTDYSETSAHNIQMMGNQIYTKSIHFNNRFLIFICFLSSII
jgi:hypothetical protein